MSNVQDDQIKTTGLKRLSSGFAVSGMGDLEAMGLQLPTNTQCDSFGVFDQQDIRH